MDFLAILIAWAAVQAWGSGGVLQQDAWFTPWRSALAVLPRVGVRLLFTVLLPVFVVAVVLHVFEGVLFGLFQLVISVVVLLYSLGRGDFQIQLRMYCNSWMHGDLAGAYHHAKGFSVELNECGADNALELHQSVRRAVLYQGFERWFAVVFWFVLLGPAAALAYRLLFLIRSDTATSQDERDLSASVLFYLEWLPSRLLGFAFGLVGYFDACMGQLRRQLFSRIPATDLLESLAENALPSARQKGQVDGEQFMADAAKELEAIQSLLTRSLVCWVCAIAVMQLIN